MSEPQPIRDLLPENLKHLQSNPLSPDDVPLTDREELILELVQVGIGLRKAQNLVARYSAGRIKRQLRWLPLRLPRRPAPLLIAAIEQNYDPPAYGAND